MKWKEESFFIFLAVIIITLTSCAPAIKNLTPLDQAGAQNLLYPGQEYRIQAGDQLDIKFYYNPELNELVTVRPDGRISLQLVHEIMAAGLTPAELTGVLKEKYAVEVKQPEITVIVRLFGGQQIYVGGEVNRPGAFNLIGSMTVLQSISLAEGLKDTARTKEMVIVRRGVDNKPLIMTINLKKVIDGTDMSQDIILKPFDIVFVPKSSVAEVNVWIDQYIRRNIPFQPGFGIAP
jgi:protein involved in polysaccharide export with SLBB domain